MRYIWLLSIDCKMKNKEKKNHHFVPQVYLGKFAHSSKRIGQKEHFFVSSYDKISKKENNDVDVKNICFKTKLYTIDSPEREKRELIENFYANTIESDYNNIFNILIDGSKVTVTKAEREKIILTVINLHLRNFYWFKLLSDFWTELIKMHDAPNNTNIYSEDGEVLFPYETQSVDQIISDHKMHNKQAFIREHLRLTVNLTKSHFDDIIFVNKNCTNIGYITSDRPVICDKISDSFRLPISKDYYLTIMSNAQHVRYNTENVIRNCPPIDPRLLNLMQFENAERLIIGNNLREIKLSENDYEKATKCQQKV